MTKMADGDAPDRKNASCRITILSRQIDDVVADEVSTNGQRRISCAGQGTLSRRALKSTFAADNGEGSDETGLFTVDRSRSHRFDPENGTVFKRDNWIECERASALRVVTDRREGDGTDRTVGKEGEP